MASTLTEFLALPDVTEERETVKIRGFEFVVRPMTQSDFSRYQMKAKIKTAKGLEFDTGKLNLLVAAGQVVEPQINQADFLQQVHCTTAAEFLERKFKAGEIAELANKITEISGFDVNFDEKVQEAKN